MPRHNHRATSHTNDSMPRRHQEYIINARHKHVYATKREAEAAAEYINLLHPEIELSVYRDIDLKWYLTHKK